MSDGRIERVGDPIEFTLFAGGLDGPTFMCRREVNIHLLLEAESLQVYAENEDAAIRNFGEMLGPSMHQYIKRALDEDGS